MEWTTKTLQHGPATIIVRRPMLTEAERAKREQDIKTTMAHTLGEHLRKKGR